MLWWGFEIWRRKKKKEKEKKRAQLCYKVSSKIQGKHISGKTEPGKEKKVK